MALHLPLSGTSATGEVAEARSRWLMVATSWAGWSEAGRPADALVGEALEALDDRLAADPLLQFLVVIEDPATMVAAGLQSRRDTDIAQQLAEWQRAAQRLLRWLHLHRSRCVCVHSDDIRGAGDGARELLGTVRVPVSHVNALLAAQQVDAITLAIGQARVDGSPALSRLNNELRVSCDRVTGAPPGADPDLLGAALTQLRSLQDDARRVAELAAQRDVLLRQSEDAGVRLRDAEREHRRLAAMTVELDAALQQGDQLAAEQQTLRSALSGKALELERLEHEHGKLQRELDAARGEAQRLVRALATAEAVGSALKMRVEDLAPLDTRFALTRSGQDHGNRQLLPDFAGIAGAVVKALDGRIGRIHVGAAHGTATHLGIDLDLGAITVGSHRVDEARVRLVEHRGQSGLVFFAAQDGSAPLLQWSPNGEEGGREFMLLIPDEPAHRSMLLRLGSTDWAMVMLCAATAELALASVPGRDPDPRWARRAARVRLSLDSLPARFRYDELRVTATSEGPAARFVRPVWGAQIWQDLCVTWRSDAGLAGAQLQMPEDAGSPPPLRAWPLDVNGGLSDRVAFADLLEPGSWRRLPEGDRALIVSLLDALQQGGPTGDPRIRDSATALRRRATSSQRRLRTRRILARVLRRNPEVEP